jgi:hypothetical protein
LPASYLRWHLRGNDRGRSGLHCCGSAPRAPKQAQCNTRSPAKQACAVAYLSRLAFAIGRHWRDIHLRRLDARSCRAQPSGWTGFWLQSDHVRADRNRGRLHCSKEADSAGITVFLMPLFCWWLHSWSDSLDYAFEPSTIGVTLFLIAPILSVPDRALATRLFRIGFARSFFERSSPIHFTGAGQVAGSGWS